MILQLSRLDCYQGSLKSFGFYRLPQEYGSFQGAPHQTLYRPLTVKRLAAVCSLLNVVAEAGISEAPIDWRKPCRWPIPTWENRDSETEEIGLMKAATADITQQSAP